MVEGDGKIGVTILFLWNCFCQELLNGPPITITTSQPCIHMHTSREFYEKALAIACSCFSVQHLHNSSHVQNRCERLFLVSTAPTAPPSDLPKTIILDVSIKHENVALQFLQHYVNHFKTMSNVCNNIVKDLKQIYSIGEELDKPGVEADAIGGHEPDILVQEAESIWSDLAGPARRLAFPGRRRAMPCPPPRSPRPRTTTRSRTTPCDFTHFLQKASSRSTFSLCRSSRACVHALVACTALCGRSSAGRTMIGKSRSDDLGFPGWEFEKNDVVWEILALVPSLFSRKLESE
ncbi:uridine-cytidine kinase, partial [Striga asiatica]